MSELSKEQCLLEEWKIGEGTIWIFDRCLTNIRLFGATATVALMGIATETLRTPEAVVSMYGIGTIHIAAVMTSLSTVFALIVWLMNRHYFSYLMMVVYRLRQIEEELLIDGEQVLKLSHGISRSMLPRIVREPWNYLFGLLALLGILLTFVFL
jgi:hypothetical protein